MKKLFNFRLLVLIGVLIMSINTALAGTRRIYFDFSAVTMWDDYTELAGGTGYVGVHCWGSGTLSAKDYHMKATGTANLAYADIDDSFTSVCFFRAASDGTWWNQTQNRSDVSTNNRFKIKNSTGTYGDDNGKYLWADSGAGVRWAPGSTIDGLIDVNNPHNQAFSFSGSTGTYSVTLSAHCTYQFKILEGTTAYGLDNNVFTGPISNYASSTSGYAYRLCTAGEGTYTFTWDNSTKKLSISFPSVTHPTVDYCYLYDHSWGYEKQYVHVWNSGTSIAGTTWPGTKVPNQTTINGETFYYCAPGDYANFQFSDGTNNNKTGDLAKSDGYGKYQKSVSSSWGWRTWNFTVTLTEQVTTTSAPLDPTVQFNGTALTSIASNPACDYYTFGGYYTSAGGGGSQVIDDNKAWKASIPGYTDGSKKWIHEGGTAELFAKWTQSITLNQNGATTNGSTSLAATYNAVLDASGITNPSKTYYTFKGWTNEEGGEGDVVIDENKDVKTVASWTDGSDKWIHNGASTLYAKWDEDKHMVTLANDGNGHVEISSSTVTFVSGVGVETASSTITAVPNSGYRFKEWTGDINNGVTFASGDANTAAITINATADEKTIMATFEEDTYSGTLKNPDGTENGSYSVTFNDNKITITSEPSNNGYHVDGYFRSYTDDGPQERIVNADKSLYYDAGVAPSTTYTAGGRWNYAEAPDLFLKWAPNTYTVTLERNDGTETETTHSIAMGANFSTFDPDITVPTREGYTFAGYYVASSGGDPIIDENLGISASEYFDGYANWKKASDVILYAHWDPVGLTTSGSGTDWNTASTWSPACVPTKEHDVTIAHAVSVSDAEVAKSVTIDQSTGSLTIASTGTLDVIGTISNANEEKLEVMAGGALIFDYSSAPAAKVHHSVSGGDFRYIALPISYVHVSNAFAGQGVYTYVWHEGSGWERRGYYDDISGNEPIAISGQSSWTFYGTLVNALFGSVAYTSGKTYAGMNMYANSWTAPIRISGVTISGTGAIQTVYTDNGGSWSPTTTGDPGDAVIPAMSAFVILSNEGGGSVSIPYNTAVRNVAVSPASAPKRVASDDLRKHITMNVIGNELKTNLRLYENEQFTNEFDNGWEAPFLEGDGRAGQLYTQREDKMVILATPDLEGTVVGFIPGEATDYTISFEGDGKGYYLNDLDEQESTLIEEGNTYVFTPNESTNATRFVISKTPIHKTTTGNDAIYDGSKARKQMIDGILYIIRDGRMYDATGALVK